VLILSRRKEAMIRKTWMFVMMIPFFAACGGTEESPVSSSPSALLHCEEPCGGGPACNTQLVVVYELGYANSAGALSAAQQVLKNGCEALSCNPDNSTLTTVFKGGVAQWVGMGTIQTPNVPNTLPPLQNGRCM
jgi:hypothetical protein